MCGIVAVAGDHGDARVDAAVAALGHRGPDGRGTWRSPDGSIALGHARLAVVDPVGGAQPIANEDGSIVATINGELYDHDADARWLASRGHRLRTRCDAEILVHLYEELGDDVVRRLRGELAFVLWDARRRRLLAARDRFGVKPLVWARWPRGGIAFASEAKALFALGVPARMDRESLFHAAHTQYPWPDRTLFEGVAQVEPGCVVTWQPGGEPVIARYGDVAPATLGDADALREALADAVRVRMRADAKICVQLSGGVDSSAVAALAARTGPLGAAFTVTFGAHAESEASAAAATAAALGVPLVEVPVDAAAIAADWPAAVAHGEGLAINGHLVGKWRLSRAMRDAGFKVALTGEGADELLAGYAHLRRDAGIAPDRADHAGSRGVMLPAGATLPLDGVRARLGFVPTWLAAKASLGLRVGELLSRDLAWEQRGVDREGTLAVSATEGWRGSIDREGTLAVSATEGWRGSIDREGTLAVSATEGWRGSIDREGTLAVSATEGWRGSIDPYGELVDRLGAEQLRRMSPLQASASAWRRTALASYILRVLGDGMEMAHGIEGRVPFLDPRVAAVAFAIPDRELAGDVIDKPILRAAMRGIVPDAVLARGKQPFLAPPLSRIAPELVQDTLRAHAARSPLVDAPRLLAILDALPAMSAADQQAWDPALMLVLSAAILEARYAR